MPRSAPHRLPLAVVLACVPVLALFGARATAQLPPRGVAAPVPSGPPALAPEKVRVFTGTWASTTLPFGLVKPGVIPFKPEYEKKVLDVLARAREGRSIDSNLIRCIPEGMPMMMKQGFDIAANAARITVISEANSLVRFIWLDGRKHTPEDELFDSAVGESIGHWEGDTLVIDTSGLASSNEIEYALRVHKMHIVERWRSVSPTQMEIQTTVEDPVALTRPWVRTIRYERREQETTAPVCTAATDRTYDKATGGQGFDLTPPEGGYIPPNAKKAATTQK